MAEVPIVRCAQCPSCKTYVPVPASILENLNEIPDVKSSSTLTNRAKTPASNRFSNRSYTPYSASITRKPSNLSKGSSFTNANSSNDGSWQSYFLALPTLILGIVQCVLILLILVLEIASLGISTYSAAGAGIWCGLAFIPAAVLTILLVVKFNRTRPWCTRVLIAQVVLLIFSFILVGIDGSYVSVNVITNTVASNLTTKYRIIQASLAFAILLMISGWAYLIFYMVVTYLAVWKPLKTLDLRHLFVE